MKRMCKKSLALSAVFFLHFISDSCRSFVIRLLWLHRWRLGLCAGLLLIANTGQSSVRAGDILVLDQTGGTNDLGALIIVNPGSGKRTMLSDFGNPEQGALGEAPASVAIGNDGRIFVSDIFAGDPRFDGGALFEVDPESGNRTLISNFGQGNPVGVLYYGLAVDVNGTILTNNNIDRVVRIDPATDARSLVTDLADTAQGTTEADRFITDLALAHSGKLFIGTARGSGVPDSKVFEVDPISGERRLLSDFINAAQGADVGDLWFSRGLALEASGHILAASGGSISAPRNLLFRIDPETGQRAVLSDFDDPFQGPMGTSLSGVAVEQSQMILVGAYQAEPPLFRIAFPSKSTHWQTSTTE